MFKYPNGDKVTTKKSEYGNLVTTKLPECDGISEIYLSSGLLVQNIEQSGGMLHVYATSSSEEGTCPYCGQKSKKVHSRYVRVIHDLSILGYGAVIHLGVRKFFCQNHECAKTTFAEQPGTEVFRYRRRTCRCEVAVARHGISASSNSASRLLSLLGIPVSSSTVLRDLHRMHPSSYEDVREVGVDDWAWRKGVTYGSIVIDLKEGWPIDLLGDRDTDSFREWMQGHVQVGLVSRDRSTDYSSAIAALDRTVTEVADKFHLVKNIYDRFGKLIAEHYDDYRRAVRKDEEVEEVVQESTGGKTSKPQKTDSRDIMFREVKELQSKGFKPTAISKKLGIARQTATKYCKMEILPARNSKLRNQYYRYDKYVEQECAKGRPMCSVFEEIKSQGFSGSLTPFYDHYKYLSDGHRGYRPKGWKPVTENHPKDNRSELVPIKALTAMVDKAIRQKDMTEEEIDTMRILNTLGWFREMYDATKKFHAVITGSDTAELIRWMKRFWKTSIATLKTFIIGIMKDFKAVRNTIRLNVTNGITEGYVNKLKAVKRLMYGRAGIELLKNKLVLEHVLFN
jgi:transposase